MKVNRVLHSLWERVPNVSWWAMAWQAGPFVHVRRPFHRVFFPLARHGHELGHVMGEPHLPWYTFELMSPVALRFYWKRTGVSRHLAMVLMTEGEVEVDA